MDLAELCIPLLGILRALVVITLARHLMVRVLERLIRVLENGEQRPV